MLTTAWGQAALIVLFFSPSVLWAGDDFEQEPINYSSTVPKENVIVALQKKIDSGEVKLEYEDHFGYVRSALKALNVPLSSQMLVFTKTSLQRERIAPETPRALYFNDQVYIGFCQFGEVMEVSAVDRDLGTVFYTLEQRPSEKPTFLRHTDACLLCHGSSQTQGVPGHIIRSVYSDPKGHPMLSMGSHRIDHTSPINKRWGGWYVTGTHGTQQHLGNMIVKGKLAPEDVDNKSGMNLTSLKNQFDNSAYLTPHSDLAALMVLEHQSEGHNLLTRAVFQTKLAVHYETSLNRELNYPPDHRWESTVSRIKSVAEPLVKYMLFSEEAPLQGEMRGTTSFAADFAAQGPRDPQGRSLRDIDLKTRLFKYPCSYLIYSPTFDVLPERAKTYVWQRLGEVLSGKDQSKEFSHLSAADRQAIVEILLATKPGVPAEWKDFYSRTKSANAAADKTPASPTGM